MCPMINFVVLFERIFHPTYNKKVGNPYERRTYKPLTEKKVDEFIPCHWETMGVDGPVHQMAYRKPLLEIRIPTHTLMKESTPPQKKKNRG